MNSPLRGPYLAWNFFFFFFLRHWRTRRHSASLGSISFSAEETWCCHKVGWLNLACPNRVYHGLQLGLRAVWWPMGLSVSFHHNPFTKIRNSSKWKAVSSLCNVQYIATYAFKRPMHDDRQEKNFSKKTKKEPTCSCDHDKSDFQATAISNAEGSVSRFPCWSKKVEYSSVERVAKGRRCENFPWLRCDDWRCYR